MKFKQFDMAVKKYSDRLAEMLRAAGIRFEQRLVRKPERRLVYAITVHPLDLSRADDLRTEASQRERDAFIRTLKLERRPLRDKDMLMSLEPNEAGYYASSVYQGEPFDSTRYRIVRGGWDHEHCYLCAAKVLPGEEWWATHPPNFESEIGLCLDCYSKTFG